MSVNVARFFRDQLLLAQHHLNDAESAPTKSVLRSSLHDTEEAVQNMADVLPIKDSVSVKAEHYRKEAALAVQNKERKVPVMDKLAASEYADRANAFEVGFAKAAYAAGLSEAEYNAVRNYAIAQLQKRAQAAAPVAAKPQLAPVRPGSKIVTEPSNLPAATAPVRPGSKIVTEPSNLETK